jgi:hypothetical protein
MHKHGSHTCVLRYQYAALQRILKQGCPEFHSLRSDINSQRTITGIGSGMF